MVDLGPNVARMGPKVARKGPNRAKSGRQIEKNKVESHRGTKEGPSVLCSIECPN